MPYKVIADLPSPVRKALPTPAQQIYLAAFNAGFGDTKDEGRAAAIAWSAVKTKYKQNEDGTWVAKEGMQATIFSDAPWASVDKRALPATAFLIVGNPEKKGTWHLPYRDESGNVNREAVRTTLLMLQTHDGAKFLVPQQIRDKVQSLAVEAGIGQPPAKAVEHTGQLTEAVSFAEAQWDEEGDSHRAVVCMIRKGWSKNGNYYASERLHEINGLIPQQRKMFADHLPPGKSVLDRTTDQFVAVITESWVEGDALMGRVEFVDEAFWGKVKRAKQELGASVDIQAKIKEGEAEGRKGRIIEQVVHYNSTDFVVFPAAGGGVMRIAASIGWSMPSTEDLGSFMDEKARREEMRRQWWDLRWAFDDAIRLVAHSDADDDAKKTAIEALFDEFKTKATEFDLVAIFADDEELLVANLGIQPSPTEPEEEPEGEQKGEAMEIKTLADLLAAAPSNVLEEYRAQVLKDQEASGEKDRLAADLKAATEAHQKTEATLKDVQKQLSDAEATIAAGQRTAMIEKKLVDSKLPTEFISESFRTMLTGAADEATIDALIAERVELVAKASKTAVKPPAPRGTTGDPKTPVTEGVDVHNDDAVALALSK